MRAIKLSAESESKRMFDHDLFEFFSRTPPWLPPVIFVPLITWSTYQALFLGMGAASFLALFVLGLLNWSLMEYWLHRVMFHYPATSRFGKRLIWLSHGVHHDWPNDKLRLVFPPAISLPLAVMFWVLYSNTLGDAHRYAAFSGLVVGYLDYDMIHYATHHFSLDNRVMKYLRSYHMAHHFIHEPTRYGVSMPLWDYVFRMHKVR